MANLTNFGAALAAAYTFLVVSFSIFAAEENPPAPETPLQVVVTAPKEEAPKQPLDTALDVARKNVRSTPGGADMISLENFRKGHTVSFQDLFATTPGVFAESNNGAQSVKLSIRGSGIQSDDVLGIAFLLDGIPCNEGDGEALPEDYNLPGIKAVEISRGANALRYGGMGLGGSINLIPRTGYDAERLDLRFEAGSFGYLQESGSTGGVHGPADYFISFQDLRSNGFRDHSAENQQKIFGNFGWKFGDDIANRCYLSFGRLDRDDPGGLSKEQLNANPKQANEDALEQDFHVNWNYLRLADKVTIHCDAQTWTLGAYYQYRNLKEREFFDDDFPQGIVQFHSNDAGVTCDYTDESDRWGRRNRFSVGAMPMIAFQPDTSFENIDGLKGPRINADYSTAINVPVYAKDQHYLTDKLSIVGGIQLAYANRRFEDLYHPSGVSDQSHEQEFWGVNPKAGLIYDVTKQIQIFGNFSRSFQPPSFDDLAAVRDDSADGVIYAPLRAQTGNTVEIGGRGELGRVSWEASLYRTWLRNELLELNDANGNSIGTVNAHSTYHQGIELGLEALLFHGLAAKSANCAAENEDRISLRQSYALNDFHFSDDPVYRDNRIAGIPVQRFNARLEYEHPCGFYAGPGLDWSITKYAVDHANTLYADSFVLLSFRAGYKSKHGFEIFFEARNLTDRTYAATVEAQADARTSDDPDAFMPGARRAFYAGFSFKW